MVIIGLSASLTPPVGRPVVWVRKLLVPAAIRFTTARPGIFDVWKLRPPIQTLPSESAVAVGSQQIDALSGLELPGMSSVSGMLSGPVQVTPPSLVIQAGSVDGAAASFQLMLAATRSLLPGTAAMKVSDSSSVSLLAFLAMPGAERPVLSASRLGARKLTRAVPARWVRPVASSTQRKGSA